MNYRLKTIFKGMPFAALMLLHTGINAQTATTPVVDPAAPAGIITSNQLVVLLIITALIVAFSSLVMAISVLYLIRQKTAAVAGSPDAVAAPAREPLITWAKINKVLTRSVPIEREADIDLGHSFDGIRELDNKLPPWWLYGFYFTIIFSVGYLYYYHVQTGWSSKGEYETAMKTEGDKVAAYLKTKANAVDETSVTLADATGIATGKALFQTNCVACHAADGGGGVGPNLTDAQWINGAGTINDVFKVIKYGVPEKGMIAWSATLRPVEMQQVASFVLTLQGTTPANPKAPQGVIPAAPTPAPADTAAAKMAVNP